MFIPKMSFLTITNTFSQIKKLDNIFFMNRMKKFDQRNPQTRPFSVFDLDVQNPPLNPWMFQMILAQTEFESIWNLHLHLSNKAILKAIILPIPTLPFSLELRTLSHLTQVIFLSLSFAPQKKRILKLSKKKINHDFRHL